MVSVKERLTAAREEHPALDHTLAMNDHYGKVKAGQQVPKRVVTEETTFDQAGAKAALSQRQY